MSVYACADFHAYPEAYEAIKKILKPEDKVYFLGDACDRGPDSWTTIKAIAADPQFVYMKGNHEDMLVRACRAYIEQGEMWSYRSYTDCYRNGGY